MPIDSGDKDFLFPAVYTPPLLLAKALAHNPIASLAPSSLPLRERQDLCHSFSPDHAYRRRRRMEYPRIVYTDLNRFICKIWVPSLARPA